MEGPSFAGAMFWMFVAAVVLGVIWRKTTLQREALATLRHAIEKGQPLDPAMPAMLERVLRPTSEQPGGTVSGALAIIGAGVGLGVMGYCLKLGGQHEALYPLIGVGCLLGTIGIALLIGGWIEERRAARRR